MYWWEIYKDHNNVRMSRAILEIVHGRVGSFSLRRGGGVVERAVQWLVCGHGVVSAGRGGEDKTLLGPVRPLLESLHVIFGMELGQVFDLKKELIERKGRKTNTQLSVVVRM